MQKRRVALLGACVLSACAVMPMVVYADATSQNAVTAHLTTEQRLARLENQMSYYQTLTGSLSKQQTQLSSLQGQLENVQSQLTAAQQAQQGLASLTQRLSALEAQVKALQTGQTTASNKSTTVTSGAKSDTKATALYQNAYSQLMKKHYLDAGHLFSQYIRDYPKGARIGESYYWRGQLYLAQGQPDKATQDFRRASDYPNNTKAPDTMLQLGVIYQTNGDSAHAKQLFQKVIANYPGTVAAKNAQQHLTSLTPSSP